MDERPELQLDGGRDSQDSGYQRRLARGQRVGWVLFAMVLVAASAGLIGPGPLSWTSRSGPSQSVRVGYERFTRHVSDTTVEIRIRPGPRRAGPARAWISSGYLSGVKVQHVTPAPRSWETTRNGVVLTFPVRGPGSQVEVRIRLRPDRIGLLRGAVGVPGREPAEFWQFVYP